MLCDKTGEDEIFEDDDPNGNDIISHLEGIKEFLRQGAPMASLRRDLERFITSHSEDAEDDQGDTPATHSECDSQYQVSTEFPCRYSYHSIFWILIYVQSIS